MKELHQGKDKDSLRRDSRGGHSIVMCRNIKKLRRQDAMPTDQELHDAALQFVRKISGFHAPSQANQQAFEAAVREVARAGLTLFESLRVPKARGSAV